MSTAKCSDRAPPRARRRPRGRGPAQGRGGGGGGGPVLLYGFHACAAALANPEREILAVFASANAAERLGPALAGRGLRAEIEAPHELARRLGGDAVHQGIVVEARPLKPARLTDIAPAGPLIVLDQVTDPRNLGAIVRIAAAFAAAGLVITRRHRPETSGLVAKAASGGLEHVPLIEVANLARALGEVRAAGYLVAGLDSAGEALFEEVAGDEPLAIVLGAEGKGLRRLTREACDGLYRIALPGPISSLNVSTAAALALHAVALARR
jgi:23S rRNA (guanosine2251-2'-O)-methyltransferase